MKKVPHPGDKIHIPLSFEETVRGLLKVKPTKDMPRPGATKKKATKKKSSDNPSLTRRAPME